MRSIPVQQCHAIDGFSYQEPNPMANEGTHGAAHKSAHPESDKSTYIGAHSESDGGADRIPHLESDRFAVR